MFRYDTYEIGDDGKRQQRRPGKDQASAVTEVFLRCYVEGDVCHKDEFMKDMKVEASEAMNGRETSFRQTNAFRLIDSELSDFVYFDDDSQCFGPYLREDETSKLYITTRCDDYLLKSSLIDPLRDYVKCQLDWSRQKTVIHGEHCFPNFDDMTKMRYRNIILNIKSIFDEISRYGQRTPLE